MFSAVFGNISKNLCHGLYNKVFSLYLTNRFMLSNISDKSHEIVITDLLNNRLFCCIAMPVVITSHMIVITWA